jgi:hypothetical protein
MMYRSGWATKDGQERVLAIDISRTGFEWALAHSVLTAFDSRLHESREDWAGKLRSSPVRLQWDPERTLQLQALPWRTVQVGLARDAVRGYVDEWIDRIEDITTKVRAIGAAVRSGSLEEARRLAPAETPYPLPPELARHIGSSPDV